MLDDVFLQKVLIHSIMIIQKCIQKPIMFASISTFLSKYLSLTVTQIQ